MLIFRYASDDLHLILSLSVPFFSDCLCPGVEESCYGLSCASRSRIPFSCLLLVSKGCVFRITLHINAFAIVDDSVRYSPFLIIITSVTIPVSLQLHSMCWCPLRGLVFLVCRLSFCYPPMSLSRSAEDVSVLAHFSVLYTVSSKTNT